MTQHKIIPPDMSCADFQDHLPELFATPDTTRTDPSLQHHLDTCSNCAALVRDLEYIAEQARQLLEPTTMDPSDNVWNNIQSKLNEKPAIDGEAEDTQGLVSTKHKNRH